ncbi:MAG: helix-turn-helix domain-containing protein [Mobilicoccus sp.]|nr:helix-turn-helix domain-containing protein [Mobilicoccus sp.]
MQVPAPVALAIGDALEAFAAGHGVLIGTVDETVTTGKAARLLGISRTYLCTLVDDGVIPCQYVGTHRRLRTRDVMEYADRRRWERRAALDEVARLSADAGLYDDDL